jgi:class 3 adenylate cyclase
MLSDLSNANQTAKLKFAGWFRTTLKRIRKHPERFFLRLLTIAGSVGIVALTLAICFVIPNIRNSIVTLTLVLTILWIASKWGRLEAIAGSLAAALGFGIFFQPPIGRLAIHSPQDAASVFFFLLTSVWISQLSLQTRRKTAEAIKRKHETECLYNLGQALLGADRTETVAWTVVNQIVPIFGAKAAAFYLLSTGDVQRAGAADCELDLEALRRTADSQTVQIDSENLCSVLPVQVSGEAFGSVGIAGVALSETILKSISNLLTVVLERVRSAERLSRQHQELDEQRRLSESLLLNILPLEVADELRTKGMVAPKYFEDVTIIFTDFVGFTLSTEHLAAEDVVHHLHDYFTAFDRICARYGLEKLKTIGDSYMCIGGLPVRNPAHPVNAVMAAFEMVQEVIDRDQLENSVRWKVRVGIHTGPVVAGVVGINKFAFDIWGDTVNFSSRMESSSQPNRINLSERTYSRVKDFFECEYRGKVLTKEKREFDMYFASGLLPKLAGQDDAIPPSAFVRRYQVYFNREPPSFPAFLVRPQPALEPVGEVTA